MAHAGLAIVDRLSPEGQRIFSRAMHLHSFAQGATPIMRGEAIAGAYLVVSGRLRVVTLAADGREAMLYAISPGESCVLAINSLFNEVPYPATVIADLDTQVAFIPGDAWRSLFRTESEIQSITLRALSVAVVRLIAELDKVYGLSLRGRLAALLLERASSDGTVAMTQQQIAADLGTAREVVARMLSDWGRRGVVENRRGRVLLRDLRALSAAG